MPSSIIGLSQNEVKLISGGYTPPRPFNFTIPEENTDTTSNVQPPESQKESWVTRAYQTFVVIGSVSVVALGVYFIRNHIRNRKTKTA
jgi:hypothetical protein